jgi:(p)ppGpp synthase/HD superfamily hydrolase
MPATSRMPTQVFRDVSADSVNEGVIVRLPFRLRFEREIDVHLYVELGFQSGRLADLVQLLAHSEVTIKDLKTDRSMYHLGMPERSAEVTFLVASLRHKERVLGKLAAMGFTFRERTVASDERHE